MVKCMIVSIARCATFACAGAALGGCGLLHPDYDPCPSDGTGTPTPGPIIEPASVGAGDNGVAERYRKLPNGTVCVCGEYEIGCHETPEGAESSMSCGYDAQGQPDCIPVVRPPDPSVRWDNEKGEWVDDAAGPMSKWSCSFSVVLRRDGSSRDDVRIRQAQSYTRANLAHFAWCARKTDQWFEYKCKDCDTEPVP